MAATTLVTKLFRLASEIRAAPLKIRPEATNDYQQFRSAMEIFRRLHTSKYVVDDVCLFFPFLKHPIYD